MTGVQTSQHPFFTAFDVPTATRTLLCVHPFLHPSELRIRVNRYVVFFLRLDVAISDSVLSELVETALKIYDGESVNRFRFATEYVQKNQCFASRRDKYVLPVFAVVAISFLSWGNYFKCNRIDTSDNFLFVSKL